MSGGDERTLLISDEGQILQNGANGFECSTYRDELNPSEDPAVWDKEQNDKSETEGTSPELLQEPVPRINSYVTKPVRALIDLYENPKAFDGDTEKLSSMALKPSPEYLNLIEMHDNLIRESVNDKVKPQAARSPLPDNSTEFLKSPDSELPAQELICGNTSDNPLDTFKLDDLDCVPTYSEIPDTLETPDVYHTVQEAHNLLKVDNRAELNQILTTAGSKLVFLFFFPDNCDMDEPFRKSFLPKIQEIAAQEPHVMFLTVYVDMDHQGWTRWNQVVDSFKTCSIVGPTFALFQNSVRIHESEAYGSKALGSMVTDLIAKYRAEPERFLDFPVAQGTSIAESVPEYNLRWSTSSIVILPGINDTNPEAFVAQDVKQEEIAFLVSETDTDFEEFHQNSEPASNSMSSQRVPKPEAATAKKKSAFKTIVKEISDLLPSALQKAVGEMKEAIDEIVRDFENLNFSQNKRTDACHKFTLPEDSLVQIVADNLGLKRKLEEAGDKICIAFICLDSALMLEVVNRKFLQKLEQVAAHNKNLVFLTVLEWDILSKYHESCQWNVPSFLVFQNSKVEEQVNLQIDTLETYVTQLEASLKTLLLQYPYSVLEPQTLVKNWTDLVVPSDLKMEFQVPQYPEVMVRSVNTYTKVKLYLSAAGPGLVLLTLFPLVPDSTAWFETRMQELVKIAGQNEDVHFLLAQVFQEARTTTMNWPTLLFYKNYKLIHEELWDEVCSFQKNKLGNLINKLK